MSGKQYSWEEIAKHNSAADCWIVIDGKVFDVTGFLADHPGGKQVLIKEGGKDATAKFNMFHKPDVLRKYGTKLFIGTVAGAGAAAAPSAAASAAAPKVPVADRKSPAAAVTVVGDGLPFADPMWYLTNDSPYYKESHRRLRAMVRAFVEKEMMPYASEWGTVSPLPR